MVSALEPGFAGMCGRNACIKQALPVDSKGAARKDRRASRNQRGHYDAGDSDERSGDPHWLPAVALARVLQLDVYTKRFIEHFNGF
jgi:hypothetical protein